MALVAEKTLTIALAGNPNSGKTTVFNALTGLRQKVANYPGITVEKKTGRCDISGLGSVRVIDLPGTYSLISRSPDEQVAMEVLRGLRPDMNRPDVVMAVVDASNLQRNLYLISQLMELGLPMVVALNMMDIAQRRGITVDAAALSQALGIPVVPVVASKKIGIHDIKAAVAQARIPHPPELPLPQALKDEIHTLTNTVESATQAERLLIGDESADLAELRERAEVQVALSDALARLKAAGIDPTQADIEAHYRWIEDIATRSTTRTTDVWPVSHSTRLRRPPARTLSEKLDYLLLHRFFGLLAFVIIMAGLFISIFWLADPIMGAVEDGIAWLGGFITDLLPEGPLADLWTDGIVAGVGAVMVFVPQIAILFLLLSILEDSGYLARAAFLMDRALSKVGLHGKSFIPLLSSFACAIPGILATRTIENRRERWMTIFIAPFMSCAARLPVYALLIGFFFASYGAVVQGVVLLGCYLLGILAATGTAWAFSLGRRRTPSAFILEMPAYKLPQVGNILRHTYIGTKEFVVRAGTIIFCMSVILWAMMYYPGLSEDQRQALEAQGSSQQEIAGEQLRHSIAGRFGRVIEPVIQPLGYDWKMGIGLVGAFAAREVFISTMGIVYSVGGDEEDTAPLTQAMATDTHPDGSPVWTLPVALSLLVWFVLAMQCISTLAVVRRETGSWKWPILMLIYMNALAYVAALMTYQVAVRVV